MRMDNELANESFRLNTAKDKQEEQLENGCVAKRSSSYDMVETEFDGQLDDPSHVLNDKKRIRRHEDDCVYVQEKKCLSYIFDPASSVNVSLNEIVFDVELCKDCFELLNQLFVTTSACIKSIKKRRKSAKSAKRRSQQDDNQLPQKHHDSSTIAENHEQAHNSSSSDSSNHSCTENSEISENEYSSTPAMKAQQNRKRFLEQLNSIYESEMSTLSADTCRFVGWRKIRGFSSGTRIEASGFLNLNDASEDDKSIWSLSNDLTKEKFLRNLQESSSMHEHNDLSSIDKDTLIEKFNSYTKKIFHYISDSYEKLVQQELYARALVTKLIQETSVWKRQISKLRELCDICNTTLFNGHFVCRTCGYAVCIDCFRTRQEGQKVKQKSELLSNQSFYMKNIHLTNEKDEYDWPICFKLNINQIKYLADISSYENRHMDLKIMNIAKDCKKAHNPDEFLYVQFIPPHIFDSIYDEFKCLRTVISTIETTNENQQETSQPTFTSCSSYSNSGDSKFLVLNASIDKSADYPNDDSKCLDEKLNDEMLFSLFDMHWKEKKPIVIRGLHNRLNSNLWTPESFRNEFGELTVNLVNCRNHKVIENITMNRFWLGFNNVSERLYDKQGRQMILKLKDWPNSEDFKTILPSRFNDLMSNLPIKLYTSRQGYFNLASSLSDYFLKPDLGPKMYIAYSSASVLREGTTNLHVDISDAFNLMVYVCEDNRDSICNQKQHQQQQQQQQNKTGIFDNEKRKNQLKSTFMYKTLKQHVNDESQLNRYLNGEIPGALWHLFLPKDADMIRTYLITKSKIPYKSNHDPIHDQIHYIDHLMMKELKEHFGVVSFPIIQYLGDSIFIPAGAPHQVRNLNSCIKVAEDFVSPQGIDECFLITDQLRHLSSKHSNREDKLQIRNILYHKMKDCISFLKCMMT